MKTIILKNNTGSKLIITSLGLIIDSNGSANISSKDLINFFDNEEINTLIDNESILINDGNSDLISSNAKEYLQPVSYNLFSSAEHTHIKTDILDFDHLHDDRYFTESEVTSFLSGKSDISHNHDSKYSLLSHAHVKSDIENFIETDYVHISGNETISGDKIFSGNITFSGTMTTVNSETINLADNIILLNSNYSGSNPSENSGLEINRGTQTHASIIWDESDDKWKLGLYGSEKEISTYDHLHDDRYFTESEITSLLNEKSDTSHTHDDRYFTESEITSGYYSKTEIDSFKSLLYLKTELDSGVLDNRYYTESESDAKYSLTTHTHTNFYTKSEIDSKLSLIDYAFVSANDSNTNVTSTELESLTNGSNCDSLHTHTSSGGGSGGTLDEAYGSWGAGRVINVDWGSVELNASGGFAPLKLNSLNYVPNQWLGGGEIFFKDNEMWFRDPSRSKFVSYSAFNAQFTSNNNGSTGYLYYGNAQTNSDTGFSIPWDGVIVGASGRNQIFATTEIEIRVNGVAVQSLYWGLKFDYTKFNHDGLNINFNKEDNITIYLNSSGIKPTKPCITLFIRKRI